MNELLSNGPSPFDTIRQLDKNGREFWSARDLQELLGYVEWRKFEDAIERAMISCEISGQDPSKHWVVGANKSIVNGKGRIQEIKDYHMTRYAILLVLLNADLRKAAVTWHILQLAGATFAQYPDFHREALSYGIRIPQDIVVRVEDRTIREIINAFEHLHAITQYRVGKYHVDLYFPDQKIVVECDEKFHSNYNTEKELVRQRYIEQQLGCRFVRYYPDQEGFSIGKVIHQIMVLV